MGCTGMPPSAEPVSQLQSHVWVALNIEDVSRFHSMFSHNPELPAKASVADWSAARLSAVAPNRFEERIAGRSEAHSKHKLDWRVEQVFLQRVHNPMVHSRFPLAPSGAVAMRLAHFPT